MLRTGNLPAVPGPAASALSSASIEGQLVTGWQKVSAADGLVPYLDYSTPTFYDTITAALQNLIGGKSTPEQFTQTLQALGHAVLAEYLLDRHHSAAGTGSDSVV